MSIGAIYQEIKLQDLSTSEAQTMVESLLKTETIPPDLKKFIQTKVEGNPFYLEEVINNLIESETLVRDNGSWILTKPISKANIPPTIQGVITARLDRLERETKRVLQEASVIGRAFLYEILKRVTELKGQIDGCLSGLERLDLIRTRSLQPDLEYIFKHALTQDVVYNGLLKKEGLLSLVNRCYKTLGPEVTIRMLDAMSERDKEKVEELVRKHILRGKDIIVGEMKAGRLI